MDRTTRQEINKEIEGVYITMKQLYIIDICRTLHPTIEYTLFSCKHGSLSMICHIIGHKQTSINSKGLESYKICSDYNEMKLEINQ